MSTTVTAVLRDHLIKGGRPGEGWGYYQTHPPRLEPTAWATLAMHGRQVRPGAAPLATWPVNDGILRERADGAANFGFHGLALVVMRACDIEHSTGCRSLVAGIERVKGIRLEQPARSRQDNSLQGWSWTPETFSWVEPTAWCLLAVKKWARTAGGSADMSRVSEAERVLINRSCVDGGWNYGNPDVLGTNLRPYVPTSAIALLAMQDRRDDPVVARSVDYLAAHALSEKSGAALSLAMIALRVYNRGIDPVRAALLEQLPVTLALGNLASIAMALYALEDQSYAAFTL
jgi:hypothetical protein